MYIGFGHLTSAIGFYGNLQPFKTKLLIFFISISKSYSVNSSNPLRLSLTFALGIYVVKGSSPVQIPLTVNETPFIQQVSKTLKNRIRKRDELTDSKIVTPFWYAIFINIRIFATIYVQKYCISNIYYTTIILNIVNIKNNGNLSVVFSLYLIYQIRNYL